MSLTAVNPLTRVIQADGPEGEIFRFGLTWLAGMEFHAGGQMTKQAGEIDEARKNAETHLPMRVEVLVTGERLAASGHP